MPQRTVVMLRLDLQGFLWRALLGEEELDLENHHLGIRAARAREGKPHEARLFKHLRELCEHVRLLDEGAAIVNLRFGQQLDREGTCLLSLIDSGAALFVHSREKEFMLGSIGRELARRSRAYEARPVAPGQEASEKQQAWSDALVRLGIERPPSMLATLAHDFMGKVGSLQLALHSMETPDGSRLVQELRRSFGGREEDVETFFDELQGSYDELDEQLAVRLVTAQIAQEDKVKVESWSEMTGDFVERLGRLVEGDRRVGSEIAGSLTALRRALNSCASVRL